MNELSPDCNTTGSIILGFFFGLDLYPVQDPVHSNDGEVFYGVVPRQDMPNCAAYTKTVVTRSLPGVFIHEFQHMISFNQHVLVRGGDVEETWLNEGLSHYAEELGGREVPDDVLLPAFDQCEDQFIGDDISNAYDYLNDPEATFLVAPSGSGGTLDGARRRLAVRALAGRSFRGHAAARARTDAGAVADQPHRRRERRGRDGRGLLDARQPVADGELRDEPARLHAFEQPAALHQLDFRALYAANFPAATSGSLIH